MEDPPCQIIAKIIHGRRISRTEYNLMTERQRLAASHPPKLRTCLSGLEVKRTHTSLISLFVRLQRGFLCETNKAGCHWESPIENLSSTLNDTPGALDQIDLAHLQKTFSNGI